MFWLAYFTGVVTGVAVAFIFASLAAAGRADELSGLKGGVTEGSGLRPDETAVVLSRGLTAK